MMRSIAYLAENGQKRLSTSPDDGTIWLYYESHKVDITEYLSGSSRSCKLAIEENEMDDLFRYKGKWQRRV